jgi:hypothetical protein
VVDAFKGHIRSHAKYQNNIVTGHMGAAMSARKTESASDCAQLFLHLKTFSQFDFYTRRAFMTFGLAFRKRCQRHVARIKRQIIFSPLLINNHGQRRTRASDTALEKSQQQNFHASRSRVLM